MNIKELAAAAQKAANETKGRGNGVLTVTVENNDDVMFAAGGDRDAIVQGLATAMAQDSNAKALIIEALKLSDRVDREGEKCNCPACQLREVLEDVFEAKRAKRKSDPSVN